MHFRTRVQLAEALGPVNRWFCSQAYGYPVNNPELLLKYYIKSGGAADFALRFDEAMSALNRWFCSEYHCREIHDPETLWTYYMSSGQPVRPDRPFRARSA
jgi:hypothetical protein